MSESLNKYQEPALNNASCSCGDQHNSKEMLNQVYDISVNFLWECIFGPTEFCYKYWDSRKFYDFIITEWKPTEKYIRSRTLTYMVDLGTFGHPKNIEEQKLIEYIPNTCIVLESESQTYGVLYSDYFKVRNRFCITRVTHNKTRLLITSELNYIKRPNFLAKGIIDRNTIGALKDSYVYLNEEIPILCRNKNDYYYNISAVDDKETNDYKENNIETEPDSDNLNQSFSTQVEDQVVSNKETSIKDITIDTNSTNTNAYNRFIGRKNLTLSRKSINSYNEYLDINNQERAILTSQASYPSLYNIQNQPKLPLDSSLDKIDAFKQEQPTKIKTIQTFTFLSHEINVDSLVRLFIIAMLCLMLINGLLYYKLLKIEAIAGILKNKAKQAN